LEVNIMAVDLGAGSSGGSGGSGAGQIQMQGAKRSGTDPAPAAASRGHQAQGMAQLPPKPPAPAPARAAGPTSQRGGILAATPSSSSASAFTTKPQGQPASSQNTNTTNTTNDTAARLAARQKRYDAVLREVLVKYRNLALLARVRGMQGLRGTSPWHVVVVQRAAEGLRRCVGGLGDK